LNVGFVFGSGAVIDIAGPPEALTSAGPAPQGFIGLFQRLAPSAKSIVRLRPSWYAIDTGRTYAVAGENMDPCPATERGRIVFCALETYSKIGGLQNFNRRVIRTLAERALERNEPPTRVLLLRDQAAAIPSIGGIEITKIDGRGRFSSSAAWAAVTEANLFVLGPHQSASPRGSGPVPAPQFANPFVRAWRRSLE
jgi:hypothetical protein